MSRQDRLEALEFLGHHLELAAAVADARTGGPVEALDQAAVLEAQVAEVEHLQRLLAGLQRVVVALHQPPLGDRAVRIEQVGHRLRHGRAAVAAELVGLAHVEPVERRAAERVEHQHAVVRGDGAARLAHDHRVLDAARVAHVRDAVHHVARVLGERVVHRRGVVGAAAVVVDAEPAADVDVLEPRAHQLEFRVDVRELVHRVLDAADVLQLAAGMAVHELQAVLHAVLLEHARTARGSR